MRPPAAFIPRIRRRPAGRRHTGCWRAIISITRRFQPTVPLALCVTIAAYVLLLGVGLESCTAIHLPEELIAPDIYIRPAEQAELYECRDRHGVVHQVRTRRHWRLDRDFPKFGPPLELRGLMKAGRLDECPFSIVALTDLLGVVCAALIDDPRGTLRKA